MFTKFVTHICLGIFNQLYARTELRKASFAIRVTEPWNTLPTEQKNATDSKAFQSMRKRYNK
jgi:hypothetical protein